MSISSFEFIDSKLYIYIYIIKIHIFVYIIRFVGDPRESKRNHILTLFTDIVNVYTILKLYFIFYQYLGIRMRSFKAYTEAKYLF